LIIFESPYFGFDGFDEEMINKTLSLRERRMAGGWISKMAYDVWRFTT
jgi:hypothetical protein